MRPETSFGRRNRRLRATCALALLALAVTAGGALADVPSALEAQGGGAPPGYYEPTFFDPDYSGDDGLVSYNDPYAGQSDAALKAKITPIQKTTLNSIYTLRGLGGSGDINPIRSKSTEWRQVMDQYDLMGGPAQDAITGKINFGSEEFITETFFATVDKRRWDRFVEETSARRERLEGEIQKGVNDVKSSLQSTLSGGKPRYDADAYDELDRNLEFIEGDLKRERNILTDEVNRANKRFLDVALRYEAQMSQEERDFFYNALFVTATAAVGVGGLAAGGLTGPTMVLTETGSGVAFNASFTLADYAAMGAFSGLEGPVFVEGLIAVMTDAPGSGQVRLSTLEKMKFAQAPINAVKGAYTGAVQDIRELERLRAELKEAKRLNQSLYYRQTGSALKCGSPCALGSLGLGLDQYVSQSAYLYAGRSPQVAPIYNAFGPVSQFDQRWINERSNGPISPFDNTWINERSQGPISQFDQSWINERSIGPEDMQTWTQKFPSQNGLPGADTQDVFEGLSARVVADLQGIDARLLATATSQDAIAELLAGSLVRDFNVDPAVGKAVADGTLIAITQALAAGNLIGGGSSGGFTDITLQLPLLFEVFDYATVDGDIITLQVTDQNGVALGPLTITLSGPGGAETFAPEVAPGRIEISVTAENTGDLFPNTGQVRILSNITSGDTTQQFSLVTGESGVLSITAEPPPAPSP